MMTSRSVTNSPVVGRAINKQRALQTDIERLSTEAIEATLRQDGARAKVLLEQVAALQREEQASVRAKLGAPMGPREVRATRERIRRLFTPTVALPSIGPRIDFSSIPFEQAKLEATEAVTQAIDRAQKMTEERFKTANDQILKLEEERGQLKSRIRGLLVEKGRRVDGNVFKELNEHVKGALDWIDEDKQTNTTEAILAAVEKTQGFLDTTKNYLQQIPDTENVEKLLEQPYNDIIGALDEIQEKMKNKLESLQQQQENLEKQAVVQEPSDNQTILESLKEGLTMLTAFAWPSSESPSQSGQEVEDTQWTNYLENSKETIYQVALAVNKAASIPKKLIDCNRDIQKQTEIALELQTLLNTDAQNQNLEQLANIYLKRLEQEEKNFRVNDEELQKVNEAFNNILGNFGKKFTLSGGWIGTGDAQTFEQLRNDLSKAQIAQLEENSARGDIEDFFKNFDKAKQDKLEQLMKNLQSYMEELQNAAIKYEKDGAVVKAFENCSDLENRTEGFRITVQKIESDYEIDKKRELDETEETEEESLDETKESFEETEETKKEQSQESMPAIPETEKLTGWLLWTKNRVAAIRTAFNVRNNEELIEKTLNHINQTIEVGLDGVPKDLKKLSATQATDVFINVTTAGAVPKLTTVESKRTLIAVLRNLKDTATMPSSTKSGIAFILIEFDMILRRVLNVYQLDEYKESFGIEEDLEWSMLPPDPVADEQVNGILPLTKRNIRKVEKAQKDQKSSTFTHHDLFAELLTRLGLVEFQPLEDAKDNTNMVGDYRRIMRKRTIPTLLNVEIGKYGDKFWGAPKQIGAQQKTTSSSSSSSTSITANSDAIDVQPATFDDDWFDSDV